MQTYWFFALIASICFEGLGRRYIPQIPPIAFLLLKDGVLIFGVLNFRPQAVVTRVGKYLFRGFEVFWIGSFIFTLIQLANPELDSIVLGLVGFRAYWLWWIAPILIAGVLQSPFHRRRAIYILAFVTICVSLLAALQFVSPPDSAINVYSIVDGEALEATTVQTTGRARVASTFSYISGFSDFNVLVPVLLLSLGLETSDKRLRMTSLVATACSAMVVPMSGSRSSVVLGVIVLAITAWTSGLFVTVIGRRILLGAVVAVVLAGVAFPDAIFGVQSRFADSEETQSRLLLAATVLPPVALMTFDFPMGGVGTGSMQNAAYSLHVVPKWAAEIEIHRYLVELGPIGFFLMWTTKLGLMVALLRAHKILKKAGRRAGAGAALSYAAVTFFGHLTFDHVWQALFFVGCGFILADTKSALEILRANEQAKAAAVGPPPIALRR
jgi:hypothetical protein